MSNGSSDGTRICQVEPARPEDLTAVLALVDAADLPLVGIPDHFANFLVARSNGRIEGVVGLEIHGADAVLRSLAVAPEKRGAGLGRALVASALLLANARGVRTVYLLTTTAVDFFARLSFECCDVGSVPDAIAKSVEFSSGVCPATSTCMCRLVERPSCCGSRAGSACQDAAPACGGGERVRRRARFDKSLLLTDGF